MPKKRRGNDKPATTRKFWVPPSPARNGGTPKPAPVATVTKATPKRKFWKPEPATPADHWLGGAGAEWKREERDGDVTLIWYWHSPLTGVPDSAPGGLVITGFPEHEERIGAHKNNPARKPYGDALLDAIDPVSPELFLGYCHSCDSHDCSGVRWAIRELEKRNPIPF